MKIEPQAVDVFFQEEATPFGNFLLGKNLQHADELLFGIEGQTIHQQQVSPDGRQPGGIHQVGLIFQMDVFRSCGFVGRNSLEAVTHQLQGAISGNQVKSGIQVEKLLDHPDG